MNGFRKRFRVQRVVRPGPGGTSWTRGAGPSRRGKGAKSAVELLPKLGEAIGDLGLTYRTNKELHRLQPEIEKMMPADDDGGVVVRVIEKRSKLHDDLGRHQRSIHKVIPLAGGSSPAGAFQAISTAQGRHPQWRKPGQTMEGPGENHEFVLRHLWITGQAGDRDDVEPNPVFKQMEQTAVDRIDQVRGSHQLQEALDRLKLNPTTTNRITHPTSFQCREPNFIDQNGNSVPDLLEKQGGSQSLSERLKPSFLGGANKMTVGGADHGTIGAPKTNVLGGTIGVPKTNVFSETFGGPKTNVLTAPISTDFRIGADGICRDAGAGYRPPRPGYEPPALEPPALDAWGLFG